MKIGALKESIILCRDAVVTPFIWGHRGLGKSQITEQTAAEHHMGFSDMRLSQCESSDLRGLPLADRESGITLFLPPADLPQGGMEWDEYMERLQIYATLEKCLGEKQLAALLTMDPTLSEHPSEAVKVLASLGHYVEADTIAKKQARLQPMLNEGILFLDELNRAQDDVIQAVFQLVLERRLGTYTLPSGWHIVCAGNYMEGYSTNGFTDPAFLDRFCHMQLDGGELTLEEWVSYMSNRHGNAAVDIIEFASQNVDHLDGKIQGELGFSVQPSRRSWEAVVRVQSAIAKGEYSEDARMGVIAGLVGHDTAISFVRYSCPVRPKDLITRGVGAYMNELRKLTRNEKTGLCWGMVSFLKGKVDDDKKAKVAIDFAKFLAKEGRDKDLAVAFCNLMIGGNNLKARASMVSNPAVIDLISKFRGKASKKTFADRMHEDPELQKLASQCAWGKVADDK